MQLYDLLAEPLDLVVFLIQEFVQLLVDFVLFAQFAVLQWVCDDPRERRVLGVLFLQRRHLIPDSDRSWRFIICHRLVKCQIKPGHLAFEVLVLLPEILDVFEIAPLAIETLLDSLDGDRELARSIRLWIAWYVIRRCCFGNRRSQFRFHSELVANSSVVLLASLLLLHSEWRTKCDLLA